MKKSLIMAALVLVGASPSFAQTAPAGPTTHLPTHRVWRPLVAGQRAQPHAAQQAARPCPGAHASRLKPKS